jgi:hypothetical protein
MDAITMHLITSLVAKLHLDHPDITFLEGDEFRWSPTDKTIVYRPDVDDTASLLHELSHALLGHADYTKDILLLEMERDAWQYAKQTLGPTHEAQVSDEDIENALDSYRDWLHARSTCPNCHAVGVQIKRKEYKCLACRSKWQVNEARTCALRRHVVQ